MRIYIRVWLSFGFLQATQQVNLWSRGNFLGCKSPHKWIGLSFLRVFFIAWCFWSFFRFIVNMIYVGNLLFFSMSKSLNKKVKVIKKRVGSLTKQ